MEKSFVNCAVKCYRKRNVYLVSKLCGGYLCQDSNHLNKNCQPGGRDSLTKSAAGFFHLPFSVVEAIAASVAL